MWREREVGRYREKGREKRERARGGRGCRGRESEIDLVRMLHAQFTMERERWRDSGVWLERDKLIDIGK